MAVANTSDMAVEEETSKSDTPQSVVEIPAARRAQIARAIMLSSFFSVCQHAMPLQSEPLLMKELCDGDIASSARALANSQGVVGVFALILNQFGGKLTDAIGRKPGLLVGPLGNIILGALVFSNPRNKLLVIVCRIIRMVITTFSNTVVSTAAFADVLKGQELAVLGSQIGAVTGLGLVCAPFIEAQVLQRFKHPRYSYLMISVLAAAQALTTTFMIPETLAKEKRIDIAKAANLKALNPFGFLRVFSEGSPSLRKMVNITTCQSFAEGKNLSDYALQWWSNHLMWSIEGIRNFVMLYGMTGAVGGVLLVPKLAKSMSPRAFTSFTNWSVVANYFLKTLAGPSGFVYIIASLIGLPGVNAANGTVMRAIATEKAVQEGFGKGEFSAWTNNLRAVASAIAPMLLGNLYASMKDTFPAIGFLIAGIVGALIPQYLLWQMTDADLRLSKA